MSLWPAKSADQADAFALLIGFRDDTLRALSQNGEELWKVSAKIHPSFKIGDRYDAPWFTDPRAPRDKRGVYCLLVGDFWNKGEEEIALGRPCTVEVRRLSGELIDRVPTRWGDNTSLAMVDNREGRFGDWLMLVGKRFTGNPSLSTINANYSNVSDSVFAGVLPGDTVMHSWMQRGLNHLVVNDLDGNGTDEVVYDLSGHWNELRLYDGLSTNPLWIRYLGPDASRSDFMRGLEVLDLDANGIKEIVVGMKNGVLSAFDLAGTLIWQRSFDSPICCIDGITSTGSIAVGLKDGGICLVNCDGETIRKGKLSSAIRALLCTDDALFVASEDGILARFSFD